MPRHVGIYLEAVQFNSVMFLLFWTFSSCLNFHRYTDLSFAFGFGYMTDTDTVTRNCTFGGASKLLLDFNVLNLLDGRSDVPLSALHWYSACGYFRIKTLFFFSEDPAKSFNLA